jgi:hypothetical protein
MARLECKFLSKNAHRANASVGLAANRLNIRFSVTSRIVALSPVHSGGQVIPSVPDAAAVPEMNRVHFSATLITPPGSPIDAILVSSFLGSVGMVETTCRSCFTQCPATAVEAATSFHSRSASATRQNAQCDVRMHNRMHRGDGRRERR